MDIDINQRYLSQLRLARVARTMRTTMAMFLLLASATALVPPSTSTPVNRPKSHLASGLLRAASLASVPIMSPAPACAATAAPVAFTLLGRTASELFPVQNLAILSWALYLLLPRWKLTPTIALIAPVLHSLLYGSVLVHMIQHPTPGVVVDFSRLEGIMPGFTLPDGAFAGWLHYCVFDPLVGLGIVLDAKAKCVPHLLCVPCLLLTLFAGPVGFLSYLTVRFFTLARRKLLRSKIQPTPPKGFEWAS
mgnify:CR=1 FL=1|jgi:hypothetical protein